jgi:hypothetical protein
LSTVVVRRVNDDILDTDAVVEVKPTSGGPATDFSVSIQDTSQVSTGEIELVYTLWAPVTLR